MANSNNLDSDKWDLVIKPKSGIFDLHLQDIWRYRDLLFLFVKRDFVAQYKQTILGPIWHLIQPLLTTLIFIFLFGRVARMGTDDIEPTLFYMSGITIWNYFSTCLTSTSNTFVSNAAIFGKVYFPRLVIPLSIVLSNIVKFAIQFGLLLIFMVGFLIFKDVPIIMSVRWLFIPFLVGIMAGIGFGLGIIISSLTTKYRDLNLLLGFAVQLGMYATPIVYPASFLDGSGYEWVAKINPLTSIVECFRFCLFGQSEFQFSSPTFRYGSPLPRIICHHLLRSCDKEPVPICPNLYCLDKSLTSTTTLLILQKLF